MMQKESFLTEGNQVVGKEGHEGHSTWRQKDLQMMQSSAAPPLEELLPPISEVNVPELLQYFNWGMVQFKPTA